jgi:hypothetical protein
MSNVMGDSSTPGVPAVEGKATGSNVIGVYGESEQAEGVRGVGHQGAGVSGTSDSWIGVYGESQAAEGVRGVGHKGAGVSGTSNSWIGVYGESQATEGVHGVSHAQGHGGVVGMNDNPATDGSAGPGVYGKSTNGNGVYGETNGLIAAVSGHATGTALNPNMMNIPIGVAGVADRGTGGAFLSNDSRFQGVLGRNGASGIGVTGYSVGGGWGVYGRSDGEYAVGVVGQSTGGLAGFFEGDVLVTQDLTVSGTFTAKQKLFTIDHPLDPANKLLVHSTVESPDALNVYSGTITTNKDGEAVVRLPPYFEALNRDFHYQLTAVGDLTFASVTKEIQSNSFEIKSNRPNVKVSWQVTGVRKDIPPLQTERPKSGSARPMQQRVPYLDMKL